MSVVMLMIQLLLVRFVASLIVLWGTFLRHCQREQNYRANVEHKRTDLHSDKVRAVRD